MDLLSLLNDTTTILTPNRRLAAVLLQQYDAGKIAAGERTWQSADILPITTWLQRLWQNYSATQISADSTIPQLLTLAEETILWEETLRIAHENTYLLNISAAAELAKSAWGLLQQWDIPIDDETIAATEDGNSFQTWAMKFRATCAKNNWLDTQSLPHALQAKIKLQQIKLPQKIILYGFTEISPQLEKLFALCNVQNCIVENYLSTHAFADSRHVTLDDEESEIRTMACWAKQLYQTSVDTSGYFIGCVIPQLENLRENVLQIFSTVFSPENTFTIDPTLLPFNISAGKSLAIYPIIHMALQILSLHPAAIPMQTLSQLLHSPYLGEAESEGLARANFEAKLRNRNYQTINLVQLGTDKDFTSFQTACPILAKRLVNFQQFIVMQNGTKSLAEWGKIFINLLALLGWPGERSINSFEYQIIQRWLDLFTDYIQLENILAPQTLSNALNYLTLLTHKTIFQPQTPAAPIQILGMLEAAGLPFKHLWVMGLDDSNWPPPPKPNPYIPARLQKKLLMPHASAERELDFCQKLTTHFRQSAEQITFSHAAKKDDLALRPSALLGDINKINAAELLLSCITPPSNKIFMHRRQEDFIDDIGPPLAATENVRGGTAIFKLQAACPFRAFAHLRLGAKSIETPTLGLRALDRGVIVHKALELFWQKIKNSNALRELNPAELAAIIQTCASDAIEHTLQSAPRAAKRYLKLELARLTRLLAKWLQLELTRPDFSVVGNEHECQTIINNLAIKFRVDRIDELADGQHLIIDYKTGKYNSINAWLGDRPDEPQLLLYLLHANMQHANIAFGQIHAEIMDIKGISANDLAIKNIKPIAKTIYDNSWSEQLAQWQTILNNLSQAFQQGDAKVDPKNINKICRDCKLQAFCRIGEKSL
jgi:ATP-dependent helicase/nuclease subunit B